MFSASDANYPILKYISKILKSSFSYQKMNSFRHNPLPRNYLDLLAFLAITVLLPIVFLYEIIIVLPEIHEPGGALYRCTLVIAIFILINIEGNILACMLIDTSVDPKCAKDYPGIETEWRHCKICDGLTPPRSWHCQKCGICILKRDHHCAFSGCCIGHRNHRYFLCFICYLFAGLIYTMIYNVFYLFVIKRTSFLNFFILSIITFDENMFTLTFLWKTVHNFVLTLNGFSLFFTFTAVRFYVPRALRGMTCIDSLKQNNYDNGVYNNLRSIFGQRMLIAWLLPIIESRLPDDGYNWKSFEDSKSVEDSKIN